MFVGQPKASAGDHDGRGAVAVEREEPHAGFARSVAYVGAHVELVEVRKPGQGGQAEGAHRIHAEADDAEVCLAFEGIDREAGR